MHIVTIKIDLRHYHIYVTYNIDQHTNSKITSIIVFNQINNIPKFASTIQRYKLYQGKVINVHIVVMVVDTVVTLH